MIDENIASLTRQIAESYAQQLDAHLGQFLRKNLIPFNGDIESTNEALKRKGMRLIREDEPTDGFGDKVSTYMLVRVIDSTSVKAKMPSLAPQAQKENKDV